MGAPPSPPPADPPLARYWLSFEDGLTNTGGAGGEAVALSPTDAAALAGTYSSDTPDGSASARELPTGPRDGGDENHSQRGVGEVLRLPGSADFASLTAEQGAVTLALWVKWAGRNGDLSASGMVSKWGGGGGWSLTLNSNSGAPTFVYYDAQTGSPINPSVVMDAVPASLAAGEWTHLAVVIDPEGGLSGEGGDGAFAFYANGGRVEHRNDRGAFSAVANTTPLFIGSEFSNGLRPLNGAVDDIRLFEGVLDDAQIAGLAGLPPRPSRPDVWIWNDGSGAAPELCGDGVAGCLRTGVVEASDDVLALRAPDGLPETGLNHLYFSNRWEGQATQPPAGAAVAPWTIASRAKEGDPYGMGVPWAADLPVDEVPIVLVAGHDAGVAIADALAALTWPAVLRLPAGTFAVDFEGDAAIRLPSDVLLRGQGSDCDEPSATTLVFNEGAPLAGLGALVDLNGAQRSGLMDLCLRNAAAGELSTPAVYHFPFETRAADDPEVNTLLPSLLSVGSVAVEAMESGTAPTAATAYGDSPAGVGRARGFSQQLAEATPGPFLTVPESGSRFGLSGEAGDDQLTLATWVRWNGANGYTEQGIVSKWGGSTGWNMFIEPATGWLRFRYIDEATGGAINPAVRGDAVLLVGEWVHVALVIDTQATVGEGADQSFQFFVNGLPVSTVADPGAFAAAVDTNRDVFVGANFSNGARHFNGSLDELRMYDVALSAGEVWALYLSQLRDRGGEISASAGASQIAVHRVTLHSGPYLGILAGGVDKLLVSSSHFTSTADGLLTRGPASMINSRFVVFRDNRVQHKGGHIWFTGCDGCVVERNHITRTFTNRSYPDPTSGGVLFGVSRNLSLIDNVIETIGLDGCPYDRFNDGETLLAEGDWLTLGEVGADGQIPLDGMNDLYQQIPVIAAIVDGEGTGQWLEVDQSGAAPVLAGQWQVPPTEGSRYTLTRWSVERALVKGNTLVGGRIGIMLWDGGYDVAVVDNVLSNSEGIRLRANQVIRSERDVAAGMAPRGEFNPAWRAAIHDNQVSQDAAAPLAGCSVAHISVFFSEEADDPTAQATLEDENTYIHGVAVLGVEMRRNAIAISTTEPTTEPHFSYGERYHAAVLNRVENLTYNWWTLGASNTEADTIVGTIFDGNRHVSAYASPGYSVATGTVGTLVATPAGNVEVDDQGAKGTVVLL